MRFFFRLAFTALLATICSTGLGQQNTFYKFAPATGILKGSSTTYVTTAAVAADIKGLWTGTCDATTFLRGDGACAALSPAGSNSQIQFNNSGAFGATSLFTWNNATDVLNVGASTTPGTFSVGTLDSMVVNGITVPIPGFALNSNIQGVYENHSYVNGVAAGGARYYGVRSEGSISSPTIVANGDHLSSLYAAGYNGTNYSLGGSLIWSVDGTPGASAMPTDLDIALSPAGSQVPTSILKLYNNGSIGINGSQGSAGNLLVSNGSGSAAGWSSPASQAIPKISGTPVAGNCVTWATSTTLGDTGAICGTGGGGGVTSVALTAPSGFSVSGSPITSSGTIAISGGPFVRFGQTVASGSPATLTVSSIPGGYTNLRIVLTGRGTTSAASTSVLMQFNGDTSADYDAQVVQTFNTTVSATSNSNQTTLYAGFVPAATATANRSSTNEWTIGDYTGTTFDKVVTGVQSIGTASVAGSVFTQQTAGIWHIATPAAITSVTVLLSAGNFVDGSKLTVYGIQ